MLSANFAPRAARLHIYNQWYQRLGRDFKRNALKNLHTNISGNHQSPGAKTPWSVAKVQAVRAIRAKYGGRQTVSMLPGGGIGPELMSYVKEIFVQDGVRVDFEDIEIGLDPTEEDEDMQNAIVSIKRNGVGLKGNIETRSFDPNIVSRNVLLRNELDLFVNVLHCISFPGVPSRHQGLNIVIIRQNTEGEYALMEHESVPGVVSCLKIMTRKSAEKLARFAFAYAKRNGRKKITTIHKANIISMILTELRTRAAKNSFCPVNFYSENFLKVYNTLQGPSCVDIIVSRKLSDGLFLEVNKQISKEYPEVEYDEMIVDNCCMQLVSNPKQFDIMLTTNLYGNIVSNVLCGLMGGAGLYAGRNYGDEYAVFEPGARNTGTKIAGKGIANPISMINASVDLLKHIGHHFSAHRIQDALNNTVNTERVLTPGGTASSQDVIDSIINYLRKHPKF